jgi:hypothetical protein
MRLADGCPTLWFLNGCTSLIKELLQWKLKKRVILRYVLWAVEYIYITPPPLYTWTPPIYIYISRYLNNIDIRVIYKKQYITFLKNYGACMYACTHWLATDIYTKCCNIYIWHIYEITYIIIVWKTYLNIKIFFYMWSKALNYLAE